VAQLQAKAAAAVAESLLAQKFNKAEAALNVSDVAASHFLGLRRSKVIGGLLLHMVRTSLPLWRWPSSVDAMLNGAMQVHSSDGQPAPATDMILCRDSKGAPEQCANLTSGGQQFNALSTSKPSAGFGQDPAFFTCVVVSS
jgi:hypothetical protein